MAAAIFPCRFAADTDPMTPSPNNPVLVSAAWKVLESLVDELDVLLLDAPAGSTEALVGAYGALLVYNLGGQGDLVPAPPFGLSSRRMRERRVLAAARRIVRVGGGNAEATVQLAADVIEREIHLIDPDLAARTA